MDPDYKRRVLFCGEASYISTGFGVYYQEVLKRLHESGEFELAELGCIPNPYSMIQMADGSTKPISLIKIGDKVISHTGKAKIVTKTFMKHFDGKVVKIRREFLGGTCLHVTENHPVMVIPKCDAYKRKDPSRRVFDRSAEYVWKRAGEIRKGDFVAYTLMNAFPKNKSGVMRHGIDIPLNDDFAFVAGHFLAEGCIINDKKFGNRALSACASLKEENRIKRFCECFKRLFNLDVGYYKREDMGVFETQPIHNRVITRLFQSLFGNGCYDKFIDPELLCNDNDFLVKMVSAYAEGDGCASVARNDICIKTVSKQLATDVSRILLNIGIRCSMNQISSDKSRTFLLTIAGQYARRLSEYFMNKKNTFSDLQREETLKIGNLIFSKVLYAHKYSYEGSVYNLEVEGDDSYMCDNYVVHNSYAHDGDPRARNVPWKFYPVMPHSSDAEGLRAYHSSHTNQFGAGRFAQVCLDCRPDLVADIRDFWMCEFQYRFPLRHYFTLIQQPTVDGSPQKSLWLDGYRSCDEILTYSEYGKRILENESNGKIKVRAIASPGADIDVFKPVEDKAAHKVKVGLPPDSFVVGMVSRNQKRKLFYDLIEAFAMWYNQTKRKKPELAKKTFLYLHTSYPDVGYDIGRAIMEFGVGSQVLMTYLCTNCQAVYTSRFAGELMKCVKCGQSSAHMPHANHSVPRQVLADIINLFDLYVQYSISEGYGMSISEAKSCLPPGSLIEVDLGLKPIEMIRKGDLVTGLDGKQHKVRKKITNSFDGDLICITPFGQNLVTKLTPNHKVFVLRDVDIRKCSMIDGEWVRADEITEDDVVALPVNEFKQRKHRYNLIEFTGETNFCLKGGKILSIGRNGSGKEFTNPRYNSAKNSVALEEGLAKLLGYYVAEGDSDHMCSRWAFHEKEANYYDETAELLKKVFGIDASYRHYPKQRLMVIEANCPALSQFLSIVCGKMAENKFIPREIFHSTEAIKKSFLQGYLRGDGSITNRHRTMCVSAGTASGSLAIQLRSLLNSIGINIHIEYNIGLRAWMIDSTKGDAVGLYNIIDDPKRRKKGVGIAQDNNLSATSVVKKDHLFMKIRKIEKERYKGIVYNLNIEDSPHYCTESMLVHNCGVPTACVDYSAMEDHVNSPGGIPIEVQRFFYESIQETEQKRALPDNKDFVRKLDSFLKMSKLQRADLAKKTRQYIVEPVDTIGSDIKLPRFSWDRTAAIWSHVLKTCKIQDQKNTWLNPVAQIRRPSIDFMTKNINNTDFVNKLIGEVWNRPEFVNSVMSKELVSQLNCGFKIEKSGNKIDINRNAIARIFIDRLNVENQLEQKRVSMLSDKSSPDELRLEVF